MPEEVATDSKSPRFICPAELLIRGRQEENSGYIFAFMKMGDTEDPRANGLLRKLLFESNDYSIRNYSLNALTKTHPEDASRLIERIIQDENDKLGFTACLYLNDIIAESNTVSIPYDTLESLVASRDPLLNSRAIRILSQIDSVRSSKLLMKLLEAPVSSVRKEAASCLSERGYRNSMINIRKLLDDCDENVRETAVVALARLGDKSVISHARVILNGELESFLYGVEALYLLGEMSAPEMIERIVEKITDLGPRCYSPDTSWMIGRIADESFLEPIIDLAENGEGPVRQLACECIGMFDDRRIAELVLKKAKNTSVCSEIMDYLPRLHDPKALDLILREFNFGILPNFESLGRLHSIVKRNISSDDVPDERIRIRLNDEDKIEHILTILYGFYAKLRLIETRSPERASSHEYHYSEKYQILQIASMLGSGRAWGIFDTMLEDPSDPIKVEAAQAYADIDIDLALEEMLKFLMSTDNACLRWETAGHIAEHWGDRRIDQLIEILEKEDEEIKWPVIEILGYLRNPDAMEPLRSLLEHDKWWIRASVLRALRMISPPS